MNVAAACAVSELDGWGRVQHSAELHCEAVQRDTAQNSKIQHSAGQQGSDVWYSAEAMYCVHNVSYVTRVDGESTGREAAAFCCVSAK